jgi:metabolite-proton symporter
MVKMHARSWGEDERSSNLSQNRRPGSQEEGMERLGGEDRGQVASIRKVALASFVGTTIEWYDFFIYGTAAALVFGPLFFPEFSPLAGTLAAFSTFAVGFVARPFGGVVMGHFGDRVGRKSMLVLSLMMMGIATFIIGLLPTYTQIGIWAPILLVAVRVVQGLGVGGEWGGAVLMATEHAPGGKRGYYGSWPQLGVPVGILLSNGVFLVLAAVLSEEQFATWGWRVPFLLSAILVGVGLFVRLKIMESPAFARVKESRTEARMPIVDVFRTYPKEVALASGSFIASNGIGYIIFAYILSYGTQVLGLSRSAALLAVMIAVAIEVPALLYFSALSDRIGRRRVFLAGAGFGALWVFPFFWLIDTASVVLMTVSLVVAILAHAAMYGPLAALFAETFGTRVRYSGASVGYQVGAVLGGGLSPIIATALYAAYGTSLAISVYLAVICVISFVSVLLMTETYQVDIQKVQGRERPLVAEAGGDPAPTEGEQ